MKKILLFLEFHKSTLLVNWGSSAAFALIMASPLVIPVLIMTSGALLSILFKESYRQNEYYLYYNQGITKFRLILSSIIINAITGIVLLILIHYVKPA